jgi:Tfp pilus assembly protein PilF
MAMDPRQQPGYFARVMRIMPVMGLAVTMTVTLSTAAPRLSAIVVPISPISLAMQAEAERLAQQGEVNAAAGYFETALAADPRNADAYVGLAKLARAAGLTGKAVAYFRAALALQPDNRAALLGEGEALAARGATDQARAALARLRTLCGVGLCPEVTALDAALSGATPRTALSVDDVRPQPVISAN